MIKVIKEYNESNYVASNAGEDIKHLMTNALESIYPLKFTRKSYFGSNNTHINFFVIVTNERKMLFVLSLQLMSFTDLFNCLYVYSFFCSHLHYDYFWQIIWKAQQDFLIETCCRYCKYISSILLLQ